MHIGTFRFNTLAFAPPPEPALLRRHVAVSLFLGPLSEFWAACGSEFLARRTCQTGLLRPTWTPARPGLLGHFLDLDSPAELLREHGALFTFRVDGAPGKNLGRVPALPADLLLENGHMLMFSSEEPAPLPGFFSFFFPFSFSFSSVLFSAFFFLKMSFHRLDAAKVEEEEEEEDSVIAGDGSVLGPGSGSGSWACCCKVVVSGSGCSGSDLFVAGRRWRGRRTPSTMSSSAERRLG